MTPPADDPTPGPATHTSRQARHVAALVGVCGVAMAVYLVLAHRQALPVFSPDEFNYGRAARSIADGDGKAILGVPYDLPAALYLYVIAPAWQGSSTTDAYGIAKAIGAVLICTTAIPTWLLARALLGARLAIVPAVLVLAGTWMTSAALILTENLALPLTTASLAAMVMMLRTPGSRWGWLALGLAAVATWSRMQCAVLVPILFTALAARALMARPHTWQRLRDDAWLAGAVGGVTAIGTIVALADPGGLGIYSSVVDGVRPSLGRLLAAAGHQAVGLVVMLAILPAIVVIAASIRRTAWKDDDLVALLVVLWSATVLFLAESAWLITGVGTWHIERYVEYVVPLALVATVVIAARSCARWRDLAGVTVGLGALLLLAPPVRSASEERATDATWHRLDQLLGVSTPVALLLATLIVGGAGVFVTRRSAHGGPLAALPGIAAIVLAALLIQSQAGWHAEQSLADTQRAAFPDDLAWVDHAGKQPVAGLVVTQPSAQWLYTSFFNRTISSLYTPQGKTFARTPDPVCPWAIQDSGSLALTGRCTPTRRFLVDDPYGSVTFYRQSVVIGNDLVGRVMSVTGQPRLLAVLQHPCPSTALRAQATEPRGARGGSFAPQRACLPAMSGAFFLDEPGTLLVRFRGGATPQTVTIGTQVVTLPPRIATTVRAPLATGASSVTLGLSWSGVSPRVTSAVLVQRAVRTPLL